MAVPNDGGIKNVDPGHSLDAIMDIGTMEPTPVQFMPQQSPCPAPAPAAVAQRQAPSPLEEVTPTKHSDAKNCHCGYSDVADESFFSVLNGIIIAIKFTVSLPWYLLSRGLEYSLVAAHWMVGRTISHPIASIWGYGFVLFVSVWVVDSMGGIAAVATEFCGWLNHRNQFSEQIHTKVVAKTRTHVFEVPEKQENFQMNSGEAVEESQKHTTNIEAAHGRSKIMKQGQAKHKEGLHEAKSTSKNLLVKKGAEGHHEEKKVAESNEQVKGKKNIRVRVVPVEAPSDGAIEDNGNQQSPEEGVEGEEDAAQKEQPNEEEPDVQ